MTRSLLSGSCLLCFCCCGMFTRPSSNPSTVSCVAERSPRRALVNGAHGSNTRADAPCCWHALAAPESGVPS
uniref:Putative secreted protein n=1 Tax=Anopheles darlingi TaxID=43151 RepID=A0A2M4D1S2_ANODA